MDVSFTLQTTPNPSSFRVLGFFKMVHLHIFLLLFHNHVRFVDANIIIKLSR